MTRNRHRIVEEAGVVVAEGLVRPRRADGTILELGCCDVLEMRVGRIRKLISYFMAST
jgi:ketosteroid isomerase-like protein